MQTLLKSCMSTGAEREKAHEETRQLLSTLEGKLKGKKFLGGETIGVVDIVARLHRVLGRSHPRSRRGRRPDRGRVPGAVQVGGGVSELPGHQGESSSKGQAFGLLQGTRRDDN
ncbi:hypothetical protein BT93_D1013 [Corymbia citriodora subsp. variegata]|nr:hypothetical protein BT93_D1013 [Corymbia citriodora subsp. variegata]